MAVFERSWQNRLVRKRNILPKIRNQGSTPTCSHHSVAGGVESAHKLSKAEMGEGFDSSVSISYLISRLGEECRVQDILSFIQTEGVVTEDGMSGMPDVETLKIQDFISLEPQQFEQDFVQLMVHVLSRGTAIGLFPVTSAYTAETTYYQVVAAPILTDSADEDEEEYSDYNDDDDDDELEEEDSDEDVNYVVKDETEDVYHAVVIISLGMDDKKNLFWRVLDSHGTDVGEAGTRRIAVNLIKEAHIVVAGV